MSNNDYVYGYWTDSTGMSNYIRYNKVWNGHLFTEEENNRLLAGGEITFINKGKEITGHLQGRSYKGHDFVGFSANCYSEYDRFPVCKPEFIESTFVEDSDNEKRIMSEYMRLYFYDKLFNSDRTKVNDYYRTDEKKEQEEGIDVTFTIDGKKFIIDEKAQMDYIYEPNPLPTFALELLNSNSGRIGWFINHDLKTEFYMFIWPHAQKKPLDVDKIEYVYYALVNKQKLLTEVEKNYCSDKVLMAYAKKMVSDKMGEEVVKKNGEVQGYRFKGDMFDNRAYLFYSIHKPEKPVNLVVKRTWLEELAISHGMIKSNNI